MLQLQQTRRYSVLAAAPQQRPASWRRAAPPTSGSDSAAATAAQLATAPEVLLTQGDASFVEHADGRKEWFNVVKTTGGRRCACLNKRHGRRCHCRDPTTIVKRALEDWREGHAVVLRGAVAGVAEVHVPATASSEDGARSEGTCGPPAARVPQQARAALEALSCPRAWSALWRGVAAADWGTWPRFGGDAAVRGAFKQADYLLYQGGDSVGWHDHYGESLLFCVVLLSSDFEGGGFSYKPLDGGGAVDVRLAAGDVVVCPSEMEHRVGAVSSGTRASLNVDFWDVDAAADRRSDFDRY